MSYNLQNIESFSAMQVNVQGKHIDLGSALRTHVNEKIFDVNHKFFNHATFANITFSREGHGHGLIKTHISMGIGKNIMVMADATEGEAYLAFDEALQKVVKQLRKQKGRIRDDHRRERHDAADFAAFTSQDDGYENDNAGAGPVVIAEMTANIQKMTVSDAAQRLEITKKDYFLFRNPATDEVNLVFRRKDGNVGWIDPGNGKKKTGGAVSPPAQKSNLVKLKPAAKKKKTAAKKTKAKAKPKAKAKSAKKKKSRR